MIGPATSALLADTRRRPGRLLLTGLAILVATVFAAGTLLFSETLRGYVAARTQQTPAAAAAVVLPGPASRDGLVSAVAGVDGVAAAVGVFSATLPVSGAGPTTLWEITSDPMGGPLTRLATAPTAGRLPAVADEVLVGAATAERTGLAPGATLTITSDGGQPRTVTVTGVVKVALDGVDTLIGTPDALAGLGAELIQIDASAAPGTDALVERIATAIGSPAAVVTGAEQRLAEAESASASVTAVLIGVGVFAGIATLSAAVIVASTFRILLTQRRTQLALLRCVGARRGQVVGAVLAEAAVCGLVAGPAGIGLAVLGGYGLLGALRLGGVGDAPELVVPWPGLVGCLLLAVIVTLMSALAPALAASRIPPVAALGNAAAGESGAPRAGRRLLYSGLLAAVAVATAVLALRLDQLSPELRLIAVAASGMVVFAAIVAAGPVLVAAAAASAGRWIAAIGGSAGRLAMANARQVPRRTAATISVLALGVGLASALLVALASAEESAERQVDRLFPADVAVGVPDPDGLAALLRADPALAVVSSDAETVYVDPAPGVTEAQARRAVEVAVTGQPRVIVQYATDARADVESATAMLRLIGLGLVGMTMLVAVVGVAVTLMLSVSERTREIGLLRAVGMSRTGVRATVAWEAALSGLGAAVLGAVVGAGYGVLGGRVLGVGSGFVGTCVPTLAGLVVGPSPCLQRWCPRCRPAGWHRSRLSRRETCMGVVVNRR
jgi:putative ABC transport system permease protein